jgi:DNA (cytosine-5)-methyltransferase 1
LKLLDLFCCCGGISKGFHDKGWECTGVDIKDGHQYPYKFIQSDVFDLPLDFLQQFDLIHASPPCQAYSYATKGARNRGKEYVNLLPKTRELLNKTGKPYIIENVPGAPLRKDLVLCGEMFGLRVIRHRYFEIFGFTALQPKHEKHKLSVMNHTAEGVFTGGINPGFWGDKKKQQEYRKRRKSYYYQVAGHGGDSYDFKLENWKTAMGIDWVSKKDHLTQMIPPKYSEYIASFL